MRVNKEEALAELTGAVRESGLVQPGDSAVVMTSGGAERLRDRTRSDLVVTGHTRTDVAETLLYRLAASPGSRGLLGLAPRNGRVVRPLLALERERTRELALAAGLPFAD